MIERAGGWDITRAPILGDEAYGENTQLRQDLDNAGFQYVFSIEKIASVFAPETVFALPERKGQTGRARHACAPTASPSRSKLIARLAPETCRPSRSGTGPTGSPSSHGSVFCVFARWTLAKRRRTGAPRGVADLRVARRPRRAE